MVMYGTWQLSMGYKLFISSKVFRILPGAFHSFQDASRFLYSIHYLNLSEECSNSKQIASLRLVRKNQQFKSNV